MLFNQKYNNILNLLLKNNRDARHFFVEYVKQLPDEILDIIHDGFSGSFYGKEFEVDALFAFNRIQLQIWHDQFGFLAIDLIPLTIDLIDNIPFDQENDIFVDNEYGEIVSPANFNIRFDPASEELEGVDYTFVIVKKKDGYYLISQEMNDAGVHCTKIDLEDFVVELTKEDIAKAKKAKKKRFFARF